MKLKQLLLLAAIVLSLPALADLSLEQAKSQGMVGEDASGYLAAVSSSPTAEVRSLVSEVNDKRREEYQRIAASNDIKISDVEKLAGRKAIQKTSPGHYIRLPGGSWQQK